MITAENYGSHWTRWDPLMLQYSTRFGVPFAILKTIAMMESSLGLDKSVAHGILVPADTAGSASTDGLSWGLYGMRPETARDYDKSATAFKLNSPDYATKIAAMHLRWLLGKLNSVEEHVVKAWNQGLGNEENELKGIGGHFADAYWAKYETYRKLIPSS